VSAGQPVAWTDVRYRRRWWARDGNQRILIAVLIALVSVTGAVLTWRAAQLDEDALDKDRQAVAETVLQQQSQVDVDTQLRAEQQAFAEYRADLTNADELDIEAERLAATDPATAAELSDEAASLREVADHLAGLTFSLDYVIEDDEGGITFDLERRADDLERQDEAAVRANPGQAARHAVALRERSQRLVGWIIPLAVAVVLLTVAQILRRSRARLLLTGGAVVIYAVVVTLVVVSY
jgi:hypothetical protein